MYTSLKEEIVLKKTKLKRKLRLIGPHTLTVTVPSHFCQAMGLAAGQYLEFGIDKDSIVMKPETKVN